jgi:hypothetical protein
MTARGIYKDPDYFRKYREKNKAHINEYLRGWRKRNPHRIRNSNLKGTYGLTLESFAELSSKQNHRCALCGIKKRLDVDHCHKTKRIRGLLCGLCNRALGVLGDNEEGLLKAIKYLRKEYE